MAISCDPNDLAAAARCFKCLSGATLEEVQTYLLCQILNIGGAGGGGGGSGQVLQGNGAPVAPPPTASSPALYSDLISGILWTWNVTTQAWQ